MRTSQRVTGKFQVIELGSKPAIQQMARLAGGWKVERCVAWIRCLLKVSHVARHTVGR